MAQVGLKEFRSVWGSTFNTSHTAPNNAAWNTTNATKLRVISVDESGLDYQGIKDTTIQTRMHGAPAPLKGLRKGSLKVSTYLTGGNAVATAADAVTTMISKAMGNVTTVSTKQYVIAAGSSASNVVMNGVNASMVVGQGILFPSTGEARIASIVGQNHVTLSMALAATPTGNAVIGHTCYCDESASTEYCDWLVVGKSNALQWQGVASVPSFGIKGTAPGEAPTVEFELQTADFNMATANLASLTPGTSPLGGDPPTSKYQGGFFFGDAGSQVARAAIRAGEYNVNPEIKWKEMTGNGGVNGVNGWLREPSAPTIEFTIAQEQGDDAGLFADFEAKTAKQVMIQLGTSAGSCVLIASPRFFLDSAPAEKALGNETGLHIKGHCDDNYISGNECASSPLTITTF